MSGSSDDPFSDLLYPFLDARPGVSEAQLLEDARVSTLQKARDIVALRQALWAQHERELLDCAQRMADAFARGATLLSFGNGGSATDAEDLAADCTTPPDPEDRPLPAISLTRDIGVITAVGNDVGYRNTFVRQVIAFGRPGDIAVGFSTSGSSDNVTAALGQAAKQGLLTVGISGYEGGDLVAQPLDFCFVAPSTYVPRIQEAHATLYHALLRTVRTLLHDA